MTKQTLLLASLLALPSAFGQSPAPGTTIPPALTLNHNIGVSSPELTKFSLDFPGGPPKQLVVAIEKAMGRPLNAIIPPEHVDVAIPPLKMSNVDVRQLFQALELTSQKWESYRTGTTYAGGMQSTPTYQQTRTSFGFRTQGPLSDESIWYFYVEKPTLPPEFTPQPRRICRYFSLAPYLDRGQTVDDITTAIQTGWKMLGEDDIPKISFHKETKLLIAVGDPAKLETIDAVLQALKTSSLPRHIDPATGIPVVPPTTVADPTSSIPPARLPQRALKTPPAETKPPGESKP